MAVPVPRLAPLLELVAQEVHSTDQLPPCTDPAVPSRAVHTDRTRQPTVEGSEHVLLHVHADDNTRLEQVPNQLLGHPDTPYMRTLARAVVVPSPAEAAA